MVGASSARRALRPAPRAALATTMDDAEKHKFAVVWTTLPVISALLPGIGHVGIATSDGVIHDFSAPYTVTRNKFMCGPPKRVWRLDPSRVGVGKDDAEVLADGGALVSKFDAAIAHASRVYEDRNHNILLDNCHSHVALALNAMRYDSREDWNMVQVYKMLLRAKWVSTAAAVQTIAPTAVVISFIVLIVVLPAVLT